MDTCEHGGNGCVGLTLPQLALPPGSEGASGSDKREPQAGTEGGPSSNRLARLRSSLASLDSHIVLDVVQPSVMASREKSISSEATSARSSHLPKIG